MKQIKDEVDAKIVALQKEIKKVKMSQGSGVPTSGLAGLISRQTSGGGADFFSRLNSGNLGGGGAATADTSQIETKLAELNKKLEAHIAGQPSKS